MKIITKYKNYIKLLESKKSEDLLRNHNNGLEFYLSDETYSFLNVDIEKYNKILKRLNMDSKFLDLLKIKTYKNSFSYLKLNLFLNISDSEDFGEVTIHQLKQDDKKNIDDDNYYLVTFQYDGSSEEYVCYDDYGIKKCIIYNVLYNENYESKVFYDQILSLLKSNQIDQIMKNIDFDQIVWYNNPSYIEYAISNNLFDINETTYLSNLWYLVEKGIITKQDFMNKNSNWFLLKEDKIYIKTNFSELQELSFMFSKEDGGNHSSSRDFVESLNDNDSYREGSSFENLYLDYLKPESVKIIQDKIQEIKLTLDQEDQAEFDEYDTWEDQIKNIDSLFDLKDNIETAFRHAQEDADSDEVYKAVKNPILNLFNMDELLRDEKDNYIFLLDKKFLIRFDNYWVEDYKSIYYNNKINQSLIEKYFSLINDNEDSVEFLKIDFPYYGFDGSIDRSNLHDNIINEI